MSHEVDMAEFRGKVLAALDAVFLDMEKLEEKTKYIEDRERDRISECSSLEERLKRVEEIADPKTIEELKTHIKDNKLKIGVIWGVAVFLIALGFDFAIEAVKQFFLG